MSRFPAVCPEVPVQSLAEGVAYWRDKLGFTVDWSEAELGLAGLSQGDSRIFLADAAYRQPLGQRGPIMLWFNASDRAEVDVLHARWAAAGAIIADPPQAQPWKLYEFFAQDPEGNHLRVFYDFAWEERA